MIIKWIWQLPQNLIGIIVILFNKLFGGVEIYNYNGIKYYILKHVNDCAVSLGDYILLDSDRCIHSKTIKHEHGHQMQSLKLGWLYLIIIGLPSAIGNLLFRIKWIKNKYNYYNQPWESWADKLGGVIR